MKDTDKRYKSDIPTGAVESHVSPYKAKGGRISLEERVYRVDGEVVGRRHYDGNGTLAIETPIRNGRTHGMKYFWDDDEDGNGPYLHLTEPHQNGLVNGTARQWAPDGTLMGIYTLVHGTGYDLWRNFDEHGRLYLAEVHAMKDGGPHGCEWWVSEDQQTLWKEVHWVNGERHGIERHWVEDKLDPGYPKFHVNNEVIGKNAYIEKQKNDASLPEYRVEDDGNERSFPDEILKAMQSD